METAPVEATSAAPAAPVEAPATEAPVETTATPAPSTEPVPTPSKEATVTVSPQGTQTPDKTWTDGLPDDLKEYVGGKGFQDAKAVLESYRNLEKLRGVPADQLLKLPSDPEDSAWNDVYMKLGKPATADGYGLEVAEGGDPTFTNWAKENFHNLNLTKDQGQNLIESFKEFTEGQEAASKEAYTQSIQAQTEALKKEWGAAYNQNVARAQAAYRKLGLDDAGIDALEQAIGFDGTMKFMHNIGEKIGEHGYVTGDPAQGFGEQQMLTPAQAKARIKSLKADSDFVARYTKGDIKARRELDWLHELSSASD